jgi:8-oxo-dGTP diphosphatase
MDFYSIDKRKSFLVGLKALVVEENRLLVLKNTVGVFNKKSQWELPGGILEINEKIKEGLFREVEEETGLRVSVGDIFTIWDHWKEGFKLKDGRILDIRIIEIAFFCQKIGGELKLSDEHSQFKWATKEELKKLDFSLNSKSAIKEYLSLN